MQFYCLYFFIVNDDYGTFFNGRIRFLVRWNRLLIDTELSVDRMKIRPSYTVADEKNRTEPLVVRAINPRCCRCAATTRWLVAIKGKH